MGKEVKPTSTQTNNRREDPRGSKTGGNRAVFEEARVENGSSNRSWAYTGESFISASKINPVALVRVSSFQYISKGGGKVLFFCLFFWPVQIDFYVLL